MHHLDELDTKIIKEFGSPSSPQWNVRASYSRIARRLGVDEETVRKRFNRAKDFGSLPGWLMRINPRLIGYEAASIDLEAGDKNEKAGVISQIKLLKGVITIADFRGRGMLVALYYENDGSLEKAVEDITSITGSLAPTVWKQAYPRPEIRMRQVDWKIIEAMADDARSDLQEVADKAGISLRTVQRRLAAMTEGKAVYLVGTPNYSNIVGQVCNYLILCPDEKKKRAIDKLIPSEIKRIEHSDTSPRQHSMFIVSCENPAEADRIYQWLRSLDGVEDVRLGVMSELIHVQDWLKGEVGKRASA
ncbi:MAG: AsnC family transcriptional regulator [Nitrososphaerota archaeon]|nr:AsnC family transcriptional regulator [Nitrososphaerota archaeon]MDG6982890.1 AsnC family transcriptional regulator [Nitrososphaerota archaeon]